MTSKLSISLIALVATTGLAIAQGAGSGAGSGGAGGSAGTGQSDGTSGAGPGGSSPPDGTQSGPGTANDAPGQMRKDQPSAKQFAPGQNRSGKESAKDNAPGQRKASGDSAREEAPGRAAKSTAKDTTKSSDRKTDGSNVTGKSDGPTKAGNGGKSAAGTSGDAKSGGVVELSGEKRTRVKTVFEKQRSRASQKVNVDIRVGVAIPRTVTLYTVPQEIVVIAPAYKRYRYFIVGDEVCIVDPVTYKIVDVIVIA